MTDLADRLEGPVTDVEQAVTSLELFFDLVFVFAITQVTGFVSADPTWTRLVEGLAILTALWWAWESYVWLGNTAGSDEGTVRVVLPAGSWNETFEFDSTLNNTITVAAVLFNLYVVGTLMGTMLPLLSLLAVAMGGYIAFVQWQVIQAFRRAA